MNDRFHDWHLEIDNITLQFEKNFKGLTNEQMNWKQNSKSWSIGQVIEHLIMTNQSYFTIQSKINNKDFKPSLLTKFSFIPKMFGSFILKSVDPEAKRKVKTMKVFEPQKSNVNNEILMEFNNSQSKLHNFIDENIELISSGSVIPSPVSKHLIYHFDTVIDIIINHQKRHFKQAMSVWK